MIKDTSRFLLDVSPDKMFFCVNGDIFHNLLEFSNSLNKMSPQDFNYHVNEDKNDFANWVYDVIGDVQLASNLRISCTLVETIDVVNSRLKEIQKNQKRKPKKKTEKKSTSKKTPAKKTKKKSKKKVSS